MTNSYPVDDIEIVPLSPILTDIVGLFSCLIPDLEDFVKDDALRQQDEAVNFTHLWISKESKILLGYVTLCNDSIGLHGKKKEEMKKIGISYRKLPALKICRMAVHKDFTRRGIGTLMTAFVMKIALKMNDVSGCRFITLEAKNLQDLDEKDKPIHFYRKNGFEILKERKPNPSYIPMYKDLKPIINERRKAKYEIV